MLTIKVFEGNRKVNRISHTFNNLLSFVLRFGRVLYMSKVLFIILHENKLHSPFGNTRKICTRCSLRKGMMHDN